MNIKKQGGIRRLFLALLCTVPLTVLTAQQKYALVIGNAGYTSISPLKNPVNDANDMRAALQNLGFQVAILTNGNLDQMEKALDQFKSRLSNSPGAYGFFFYAGHGVQSNGENYLIPVDANITTESYLRTRALAVQIVLDEINEAGNALNIVVLDACRDNPFGWGRGKGRGLQVVSRQPADSIIVYATSAGSSASDGEGKNGLFTGHLLNNLKIPGLSVRDLFDKTGGDVKRASGGIQIPAVYSQFFDLAYLGDTPRVVQPVPAPQPAPVPAPTVQPVSPPPEGPVPNNMVRINGGTFMMGSPASEAERGGDEGPQHRVTVSSFYMGKYEVTQKEYQELMGTNPSYFKGDNLPVERVSWYDAVNYCNALSRKEGLTPAYTVNGTSVTWNRNADGYRLPTEAEWEYACRAGTTTPFSTGNNITTGQANYDGNNPYNNNPRGEYRSETTPVGSFAANPWGLYDMHGNVWEWCWDWYGDYASGSQTDPSGASSGSDRVSRGGCWGLNGLDLRSARRYDFGPSLWDFRLGFRVLCPSV